MSTASTDELRAGATTARPHLPSSMPPGQATTTVTVYELPVRIWHWVNTLAVALLCVTGYFIGQPLPSVTGDASDHFIMGNLRYVHFASGYIFAVGLIGRVYWAFVGNKHSRELFTLPVLRKQYWASLWRVIGWYAFLKSSPGRYVGHNPLARLSMFSYMFLSAFMAVTGFALYGEGTQSGSWAERAFGWVIPLLGQSQNVHTLHRLGMWGTVLFVIVHIYAVIRDDICSKQSIISSMVSGRRAFKD